MAEPTNGELTEVIRRVVKKVDLENTGIKKFIKLLSRELGGINLKPRSDFIKKTLTEIINESDNEEEEEEDEDDEEEEEEEEEEEVQQVRAKPKKSKKKKASTSSGPATGGLATIKEISDELADLLGKGKRMARTEVVREMWVYIRKHELQNPKNKREIILDERMRRVFGCDTFTMFTMNKYVGAHIHPFKPVDLTTSSTPKKRKSSGTKGPQSKEKKARQASTGLQAPYQLSPELARVVGKQILPRPQVTKKLWEYIREHDLQNPEDRREILCDQKLKLVMGGLEKVTMFSMNKYVTPHLLEKLDPSYYVPSDQEPDDEDEEE